VEGVEVSGQIAAAAAAADEPFSGALQDLKGWGTRTARLQGAWPGTCSDACRKLWVQAEFGAGMNGCEWW
jgi:hypothetical protein